MKRKVSKLKDDDYVDLTEPLRVVSKKTRKTTSRDKTGN
jgi:hypothetical protein